MTATAIVAGMPIANAMQHEAVGAPVPVVEPERDDERDCPTRRTPASSAVPHPRRMPSRRKRQRGRRDRERRPRSRWRARRRERTRRADAAVTVAPHHDAARARGRSAPHRSDGALAHRRDERRAGLERERAVGVEQQRRVRRGAERERVRDAPALEEVVARAPQLRVGAARAARSAACPPRRSAPRWRLGRGTRPVGGASTSTASLPPMSESSQNRASAPLDAARRRASHPAGSVATHGTDGGGRDGLRHEDHQVACAARRACHRLRRRAPG